MAALLGLACGILAALPAYALLCRPSSGIGAGIGAVLFAFLLIQVALLAVRALSAESILPFGTMSVLAFLTCVVMGVINRERRR